MSKRLDIGIDPDSAKHGCAIAIDKYLVSLESYDLFDLVDFLKAHADHETHLHIENVTSVKATFAKNKVANQKAKTTVSRSIGMVHQSQVELERFVNKLGLNITIHHYKPSSNWKPSKGGKQIIKQVFGYAGSSNEDTRSACYFLYLGIC